MSGSGSRERRRVLVIDDETTIRELIAAALTDEGYAVLSAKDGEEGLRHARDWQPHVILCDLVMPGMSGFDFVPAYRAFDPPHAALVLLTAAGESTKARVEALHPDEFITKPFDVEELLAIVAHHARPRSA